MSSAEAGFLGKVSALAAKDLRIEARGRDTLAPMVAFSVAVVLVLAFSLPEKSEIEPTVLSDVLSGFFWITVLFAGLVGFARTFDLERQDAALESLLLAPLDRSGLFLAKAFANLVFVILVEVFLIPAVALLFDLDLSRSWPGVVLVAFLADLGFVFIGTLFATLAAQTRSRELLLPLLALPALVPLFIAATELTSDLYGGARLTDVAERGWFGILVAFDLLFGVIGSLTFEFAID